MVSHIGERWIVRLLVLMIGLLVSPTLCGADALRAWVEGVERSYEDVKVMQVQRQETDSLVLVRMQDGEVYPLELSRILEIRFGDGTNGAKMNISLGPTESLLEFPGSTVISYQENAFFARESGDPTLYRLNAANVAGMTATEEATGETQENPWAEDSPIASMFANTEGLTESELEGVKSVEDYLRRQMGQGGDSELTDEERQQIAQAEQAMQALGQTSLAIGILGIVYMILFFTTLIWMVVWAFGNDQVAWGVGLLATLPCCIGMMAGIVVSNTPLKGLFLSKYSGAAKPLLSGLVITEILIYIAFFFLKDMLERQLQGFM